MNKDYNNQHENYKYVNSSLYSVGIFYKNALDMPYGCNNV